MDYQSKRRLDLARNEKVTRFIDEHVYPKLKDVIVRITDKDLQLRGVDLTWNGDYVDEKCATDYINKNLQTFAFEVSSLNNKDSSGWFLNNPYILTQHYLLTYLKGDIDTNRYEEIEMLLVSKVILWRFMNRYGLGTRIEKMIADIRSGILIPNSVSVRGSKRYSVGIEGVTVVYSEGIPEKPINIVISKDILLKLCTKRIVYQNGIVRES